MPHNRGEREAAVRSKYGFVVFGGEYGLQHVLLAAVDAVITGGNTTFDYLKDEVKQFGIDLASSLASAGIDPTTEPLYVDKMIFENWEKIGGIKWELPNKFVPYVAAKKRSNPSPVPPNTPSQPNHAPPGPSRYRIDVVTATGIPSGTGATAYVVLHGTKGSSIALEMTGNGPLAGRFTPGSTVSTTYTLPDLGVLTGLTIGHDNTGLSPDWHVDAVTVVTPTTTHNFSIDRWIGGRNAASFTAYG
jgi:hypothetical protein